jgi:multiple sugar transport system permease protein
MFGSVFLATLAGFALAKFKFRGNLIMFAIFIGGNFVPFQILMIPVRDLTIGLGIYDTIWALIIFHVAFQAGFCTLFMRNFIVGIPDELLESCRLEGAGEFKIFYKIILPLVRPALAALAVLIFTFVWNDYFWALVLVQSDEARPVTAGISALRGQWLASWNLISAGSIVAALPPVAMFFAMQKHFIAGLTLGATKG